jgi:hypothetical protein
VPGPAIGPIVPADPARRVDFDALAAQQPGHEDPRLLHGEVEAEALVDAAAEGGDPA